MKILGVSAGRIMGNSEILLKYALKGAEAAGCEVEIIRLQDFQIKPCIGCELCIKSKVIKGGQTVCSIPSTADQHDCYIQHVLDADGFIFAAPCYNLTACGRLFDALNRQHKILSQLKEKCNERAKYAATIGVAGTDWSNFLMPLLNFCATEHCSSNMHLVDQMLVEFVPAVGAVALEKEALDRAFKLGENIAKAVIADPGLDCYVGDTEEVCPICHGTYLQLRNGQLICPASDIVGHVSEADGKVTVTWEEGYEKSRWSAYGSKKHLDCIRAGHAKRAQGEETVKAVTAELRDYLTPIKPAPLK